MKNLIPALICLFLAIPCQAGIITVDDDGPADFNNIQAAIDDANDGDVVLVAPGTYTGDGNRDIDFLGKPITVQSIDPNDPTIVGTTIIDCEGTDAEHHRGFKFHSGEDANSVLAGIKITNGNTNGGGGIICYNESSPVITNCIISGNLSHGGGGGIYCDNSSPTIKNCIISDNVSWGLGGVGGGMYSNFSMLLRVHNCLFTGNSAYRGGGMANDYSNLEVVNCEFRDNSAGVGGGMANDYSNLEVVNCEFRDNSAGVGGGMACGRSSTNISYCMIINNSASRGGGISCYGETSVIRHCTIIDNTAEETGGGIFSGDVSNLIINSCILWGGSAEYGPEIALYPSYPSGTTLTVSHCDVQGGQSSVFVGDGCTLNWGQGNIEDNPILTPYGHLQADSPCINSGDPNYSPAPGEADIDGEPTVHNGRADIGSDEFIDTDSDGMPDWYEQVYFGSPTAGNPGDDPDEDGRNNLTEYNMSTHPLIPPGNFYVSPYIGSDGWDGLSPIWDGVHGPKATIQAAIDAAPAVEGSIILAAGTYTGAGNRDIDFHGKAITVRSTDPCNPAVVTATVIDCQGTEDDRHCGFNFRSGEDANSVLTGLTITNGYGPWEEFEDRFGTHWFSVGGAIFCNGSSPTITNCNLRQNKGGGAITCWNSSPTISHCTISSNQCSGISCRTAEDRPSITDCLISDNLGGVVGCHGPIVNCTISGNTTERKGGGLVGCSGPIINCTISGNKAEDYWGGGLADCSGPITNCIISGNTVKGTGGGLAFCNGPITNCIISGNTAEGGGGLSNCYSPITNCIISGNSGGGLSSCYGPITNCTITGNIAANRGGGLTGCSTPVTNCIIRDNLPEQINSSALVTYSNVEDGWEGEGNIDADPDFAFPHDYHLMPTSPCVDAGTNTPTEGLPENDFDGNLRPLDGNGDTNAIADMGAYEYNPDSPSIAASATVFSFIQNWPQPNPQTLLIRNCGGGTLNWEIIEDCPWLQAVPQSGYSTGDINEVTLLVDTNSLIPGLYNCTFNVIDSNATNNPVTIQVTVPVGITLQVPDDFFTIQEAIDAAANFDVVLVADGTYTGDGNRDLDFHGKAITVCSENGPNSCIIDCNGPHRAFFFHSDEEPNSLVQGFTLTNGYADYGSAIYCGKSSPTINNCTITGNSGGDGAIYCVGRLIKPTLTLTNCTISNNRTGIYCGNSNLIIDNSIIIGNNDSGIRCWEGGPSFIKISNCSITDNSSTFFGGGICCEDGILTITDSTISRNSSLFEGGGIYADYVRLRITNSSINGNSVKGDVGLGGGILCDGFSPKITNCTITGNSASGEYAYGGGIFCSNASPTITNCTITGNSVNGEYAYGGGIYGDHDCEMTLTNSIFWGNKAADGHQLYLEDESIASISYSDVQGGRDDVNVGPDCTLNWGPGNIDADPHFAFSTDSHLMPGSPCIDAGTNTPIGGLPESDIEGNPRPLDGNSDGNNIVDMGAYEHNPNSPSIAISPSSLSFYRFQGWLKPEQTLLMRNCSTGTLNWQIIEDCPWLQAVPTNGVSTGNINEVALTVDINSLVPGYYTCIFQVRDSNAANSPVTVRVTLRVGEILRVPDDFFTIQAAIDAADDYDMVLVADDTYTGEGNRDIDFLGKVITVRSENGPENCIIDCDGTETEPHRGFYFHNYEDTDSILEGFTITNGYGYDGAIQCRQSSPTIENCNIMENQGHGIYCRYSSPTITNCTISGNSVGGIYCENGSPTITKCTISGNSTGLDGGGISCRGSGATITDCIISDNVSWGRGAGGGISIFQSICLINNCTITGNIANKGGGIRYGDSSMTLTNCILWGNEAQEGPEIYLWGSYGNAWVSYTDVQGGWPGEGNINADPCFIDPCNGDYHLLRTSPCIDAATDAGVYTDIEGNIRPFDFPGVDNNGELPEFDMGAYEATAEEAELMILPRVINRRSRQRRIWAWVRLPEGVTRDQIDSNEPLLLYPDVPEANGIEAIRQLVFQNRRRRSQRTSILAFFDKAELMDAVGDDGSVELQVVGNLRTGQYFYGTDTVRITDWRRLRSLRHR